MLNLYILLLQKAFEKKQQKTKEIEDQGKN